MIEAIEKRDMVEIGKNAVNVLEEYTLNNYSSVRKTKEKMNPSSLFSLILPPPITPSINQRKLNFPLQPSARKQHKKNNQKQLKTQSYQRFTHYTKC